MKTRLVPEFGPGSDEADEIDHFRRDVYTLYERK